MTAKTASHRSRTRSLWVAMTTVVLAVVEGAGRLVCEHEGRLLDHEPGESHTLLFSATMVVDLLRLPPRQTNAIEGIGDSRVLNQGVVLEEVAENVAHLQLHGSGPAPVKWSGAVAVHADISCR